MKKLISLLCLLMVFAYGFAQNGNTSASMIRLPNHNLLDDQDASMFPMQTIALASGINWVSFDVETTLDDLQAALLNALGNNASSITITSQNNGYTNWNGNSWRGSLNPFEVNQMFVIEVPGDCEISLSAMPIDPAEHQITIMKGINWIGFPFSESMNLSDAFNDDFAVNGDKILAPNGSFANYNGINWEGGLTALQPGQGYKFESTTTDERTFVFPIPQSK